MGLSCNLTDWLMDLHGHKRRVGYIEWHPTAENVLASAGFDYLVRRKFILTRGGLFALDSNDVISSYMHFFPL